MTIVTELAAMAAGLQSDNRSDTANSKERIFFFITNYGTSPGKAFQALPKNTPGRRAHRRPGASFLFLMEWAELRPLQSVVHHVQVVIVIAEDGVAVVNGHAA